MNARYGCAQDDRVRTRAHQSSDVYLEPVLELGASACFDSVDPRLNAPRPKDVQEHHLLNILRLALLAGTIRNEDYPAMASIDLAIGLPNEAKAVLAKGNRTSGDLFNDMNKMLANDQGSLTALAAEAGKQTNGEIDVKLGESYMTYGRHDEAIAAIRKGIEKGGLKNLPDAQTTLGIALYSAGKKDEALAEFRKAETATTSAGPVAHTWLLFLQRPSA